jgi:hypothetical protein
LLFSSRIVKYLLNYASTERVTQLLMCSGDDFAGKLEALREFPPTMDIHVLSSSWNTATEAATSRILDSFLILLAKYDLA